MKLNQVMRRVADEYKEVNDYWDFEKTRSTEGSGETLAEFIVRELEDTYCEEYPIFAVTALENASDRLRNIAHVLRKEFKL